MMYPQPLTKHYHRLKNLIKPWVRSYMHILFVYYPSFLFTKSIKTAQKDLG